MVKRIVTKIGDVFCAEIDGKYKCYFQYICSDMAPQNIPEMTPMDSSVIRVFKTRYPLDHKPDIDDIVKDEVLFYTHTVLQSNTGTSVWTKVGNSNDVGKDEYTKVLFGVCSSNLVVGTESVKINPFDNWLIWHIGEPWQQVRTRLSPQQLDELYSGRAEYDKMILEQMKYGYDRRNDSMYDLVKRRPRPDVDSYCQQVSIRRTVYYHFHGENLIRQVVMENGVKCRLSQQKPACDRYSIDDIKFWDINWRDDQFITEEEFRQAWDN